MANKRDVRAQSTGGSNLTGKGIVFFLLLIGQSTCIQLFVKLSQSGGDYKYNTMSVMTVVEGIKLFITLFLMTNQGTPVIKSVKNVNNHVHLTYIFLACSYAAYNQLCFYGMKLVDPGTYAIFKTLAPSVVALLNFVMYGENLTSAQVCCILIQAFGTIPVVTSFNCELGKVQVVYGYQSIIVMTGVVVFGALNSVFNASVVKKQSVTYPVNVQNGILYTWGCFFNLLFYIMRRPADGSFFTGYRNFNLAIVLLLQSTGGITVSFIYKHGDALLKAFAQPVVSAILLFLSKILFGTAIDIIKVSGAGTVIVSTMLYMKQLPPRESTCNARHQFKPGLKCYVKIVFIFGLSFIIFSPWDKEGVFERKGLNGQGSCAISCIAQGLY